MSISSLSLMWPFGFFLASLIPILVWAYFRKEKRNKIYVSSLLLYATLPKRPRAKRKFKPPLQFYLELLALFALLLAIVGPFLESKKEHIAILLDSSYSMNATDEEGRTHTDKVLEILTNRLTLEPRSSRFSLFRSSPLLKSIGSENLEVTNVLPSLENDLSATGTGSLEAALEQLQYSQKYDRILVLSDRTNAFTEDLSSKSAVEVLSSRQPVRNVFIEKMQFLDGRKQGIAVVLGASSDSPIESKLKIYGSRQVGSKESLIKENKIRIVPPNSQKLKITFKGSEAAYTFYRAEISSQRRKDNSLAEDDSAWLAKKRSSSTTLLLVGYPNNTTAGLETLASAGNQTVHTMSAKKFASTTQDSLAIYDVVMFYGIVPKQLPKNPSLFILPPEGSSDIPVERTLSDVVISSWESQHPLLRYLNVPLLKPQISLLFSVPDWGQSILRSQEGPIAFAGIKNGTPILSIGFELLPFEGRKTLSSSVLMLNAIQWLSGGKQFSSALQIGSSIRLPLSRTWIVRKPDGTLATFPASSARQEQYIFPTSGLYVVTSASPGSSKTVSRVYTVQGFSVSESYTWRPPVLPTAQEIQVKETRSADIEEYWQWAAIAALLILLLQAILTSSKRWGLKWS